MARVWRIETGTGTHARAEVGAGEKERILRVEKLRIETPSPAHPQHKKT